MWILAFDEVCEARMKISIIGDIHGKTESYQNILCNLPDGQRSIQVGDLGLGFKGVFLPELSEQHKWFRGNHDNPEKCRAHANYLGDYGYLPEDKLFWLAGAYSTDRLYRIEGISWWPDEELSIEELGKAVNLYEETKPEYVLSHECPTEAAVWILQSLGLIQGNRRSSDANSRTAQALQIMYEIHQPKVWVFGHFHVDKTFHLKQNSRTEFHCVGELSQYVLEIGD
jgi:predicted phosphodiesterase